jgi:DNA-binding transcriptional regulator YhcF (GntR family)
VILSAGGSAATTSVFIPSLKDMSAITGLKQETVSRVISQLRRLGILTRQTRSQGVIDLHSLNRLPLRAA